MPPPKPACSGKGCHTPLKGLSQRAYEDLLDEYGEVFCEVCEPKNHWKFRLAGLLITTPPKGRH